MSVLPDLPPPAASLTSLELQILRLLASGHTVKSIAADLGRSEGAINERLRDARRKTGATSSRELARRLDAQKIWDRNFDLHDARAVSDASAMPPLTGHHRSKGLIVMALSLPIAAAVLIAIAGPGREASPAGTAPGAAIAAVSPLVGDWSLDVGRIPENERPQRVTIGFRQSSDGVWTTTVEMVGADGQRQRATSSARADGAAVPVMGTMAFIDSASLRHPAPDTLVLSLGKGGRPVSTRVYTVAPDGQSMTETIIWPGDSVPKMETTLFHRVG